MVFINSEIFVRDFYPQIYLGKILSEMGVRVIVGEQQQLLKTIYLFKPGVFIDKSAPSNKSLLYRRLKHLGWKIITIDAEGLSNLENLDRSLKRISEETLRYLDYFCCWTRIEQQAIIKRYPNYQDKIVLLGGLRLALIRRLMLRWPDTKTSSIVWSSSNPLTPSKGEWGQLKLLMRLGRIRDRNEFLDYFDRRLRTKFLSLKFISHFNEYESDDKIYRPHPNEDLKATQVFLNSKFVIDERNKPIWLSSTSTRLFHSGCTSSYEFVSAGRRSNLIKLSSSRVIDGNELKANNAGIDISDEVINRFLGIINAKILEIKNSKRSLLSTFYWLIKTIIFRKDGQKWNILSDDQRLREIEVNLNIRLTPISQWVYEVHAK